MIQINQTAILIIYLDSYRTTVENIFKHPLTTLDNLICLDSCRNIQQQHNHFAHFRRIKNTMAILSGSRIIQIDFPVFIFLTKLYQHLRIYSISQFEGRNLPPDIILQRFTRKLSPQFVNIRQTTIERVILLIFYKTYPKISHRNMGIQIVQETPFIDSVILGFTKLDTNRNDIGQRSKPMIILPAPLTGSGNDIDTDVSPGLLSADQRDDHQRINSLID